MLCGYLDNAATTELCVKSKQAMTDAFDCFGNPSSLHSEGIKSAKLLESSRKTVADFIKADKGEIYFTSGGTEADNLAVFGATQALKRRGNRIVTTSIEHSAILNSMKELEKQGFEVVYINPDESGTIPIEKFKSVINDNTILVSVMFANNETGAFLPVDKLKSVINQANSPALLHCDATQGFGKYSIIPSKLGIDLMTFSAHKIHGPKGIGALYIKNGVRILPHIFGGGQEKGIRSGTESLILAAGFAGAVSEIGDIVKNAKNACSIKHYIIDSLSSFDDVVINSPEHSSDYILNFSVLGIRSETMLHFLEQNGVYISSGSACSKGKTSYVLKEMGLDNKRIDSALRISLSRFTILDDAKMLIDGINRARSSLVRSK